MIKEFEGDTLFFGEGKTAYLLLPEFRSVEKVRLVHRCIDTYQKKEIVLWLVYVDDSINTSHKLVSEAQLTFDDTEYKKFQTKKDLLDKREEIDKKLRKLNAS